MPAFQRVVPVRFGHCDPGGWVFYPRYFEMISSFVEDWFEHGLGMSLPALRARKGLLTPSVHFNVDFFAPSRHGDRLTYRLRVVKVGRSSCELSIDALLDGRLRMTVRQVLVFIDAARERSAPIPRGLATRMRRFTRRAPSPRRVRGRAHP